MSDLKCSFCSASQYSVSKLITGPDICICGSCVWLCVQILLEEKKVFDFPLPQPPEVTERK